MFIDAGHSFNDVRSDYVDYGPFVKQGGIIAFHDALERDGYPELGVHKFVNSLEGIKIIGQEVGIAWMLKG